MRPNLIRGLALASLVLAVVGCNQERKKSIELMNAGIEKFRKGNVYDARRHLEMATEADPTNAEAFYALALVISQKAQKETDYDEALRHVNKALEVDPEDYRFYYRKGFVLSKKRDWGPAITAFQNAISRNDKHAESHYRLGLALEMQAKFDSAQEAYANAVRARPRFAEARNNALGNLYARFERYPQAIQVFKNAIENNPNEASNFHDLGVVYAKQLRFDEAIEQFKAALQISPANQSALFNIGMGYASNDDPEQAIYFLKRYLALKKTGEDPARVQTAESMVSRLEAGAATAEQQ